MPRSDHPHLGPHLEPGLRGRLERRLLAGWLGDRVHPALRPLGAAYGLAMRLRRRFHGSLFRVERAERPVISLGNLTVGGSGKTPLGLTLARLLLDQGHQPAVLSRGYGRRTPPGPGSVVVSRGGGPVVDPADSGDEPWLMAAQLPGLRVVVDSNRARAARTAVEHLDADFLLLDDGFQQLGLAADCRILLIPFRNPFGNGAVLPAGPLREPLSAHRWADILVSTGSERPAPEVVELAGGRPVFAAEYHSTGWRPLAGGPTEPAEALSGRRVVAFCGLARPEGFERSLTRLGPEVRRFLRLRDHQVYDRETLDGLGLAFLASGAEFLVTTAKDAVKIPSGFPLPVMVLQMEMVLPEAGEFLETVLRFARRGRGGE